VDVLRPQVLEMSKIIRHRGTGAVFTVMIKRLCLMRLAIVDPASGKQPLLSEDGKLVLAANGEIYNQRVA
jgi:asparagine synthase (glutamine-hydrolysing)